MCYLYDKKNYVRYIKALKQALNHGVIPERVHMVMEFNQKAWLKPYIDMNTELRAKAKNDLKRTFSS